MTKKKNDKNNGDYNDNNNDNGDNNNDNKSDLNHNDENMKNYFTFFFYQGGGVFFVC